ncbi:hypothetical protein AAVH_06562 [Aphelenchoides avenae]|nr:hypothetical protein AAVH_06562 [Aphelenchus avenae]
MHPLFTHVFSMPTLPTPAPFPTHPLFHTFGAPAASAAPQPSAVPQTHGLPLLRIPTPEEVEKAIPESGRQLITRVAHTLLGYHRYTKK